MDNLSPELVDVDKIMIHYADGTKEEMSVTAKASSDVEQIKEYSIKRTNWYSFIHQIWWLKIALNY